MNSHRALCIAVFTCVMMPLFGATVTTDQANYTVGQTVMITGAGFQAGENVTLRIDEVPDLDTDSPIIWTVVANGAGGFTDSTFPINAPDVGVSFTLTATGQSSGLVASATFTDGSVTAAPIASFKSNCTTASSTFNSGDTVCAHSGPITVQGSGNGNYHVQWIDPNGAVAFDDVHSAGNGASANDSHVVTTAGVWTLQTCKGAGQTNSCAGNGNFLASTTFTVAGPPTFQVRYASNLINGGDAVVNITNTGASSNAVLTPGQIVGGVNQNNINGDICVNIYTFAADEQEVACCSCLVTPNALWSASVKTALLNSTLTPSFPNEVVIKLISTAPIVNPTTRAESCNPAAIQIASGTPASLTVPGPLAWGTSLHGVPTATGPAFQMTETPFVTASLSAAELQRDVQECQFIQILGSGQFGICKGCSNVGLGANAQ